MASTMIRLDMHAARMFMLVTALIIPVIETWRRWNTWREYPPAMFDDYVLGAIMIWVVWVTRREQPRDRTYLAAATGFGVGVAAMSALVSLHNAQQGLLDPSGLTASTVAAVKGGFVLLGAGVLAAILHRA